MGVNDAKKKFNKFWDIAKNILDEITAVDDIHHSEGSQNTGEVVVNMVKAISARDLYEKIQQRHLNKIWLKVRFHLCLGSNFNFGQKTVPPTGC